MIDSDEEWLSFAEAAALVRDREPTISIGKAEAIVRAARKSGEVRVFVLTDEGRRLLDFGAPPLEPFGPSYSKADLTTWLDDNRPMAVTAKEATAQPTDAVIWTLLERYKHDLPLGENPSMDGAEKFVWKNYVDARQQDIRRLYGKLFDPRRGRPRKNNPSK